MVTPTAPASPASPRGPTPPREQATRRAAQELEATFVGQLLRTMPFSFGAGDAQPFADLLMDEYGKLVARSGGVGIADAVVRQLERIQKAAP